MSLRLPSMPGFADAPAPAEVFSALGERWALAREPDPEGDVRRPSLRLLLGELASVPGPVRRMGRPVDLARAARPRTVMLLPGLATHPSRMRYMARQLEGAGHVVKRWGLGFNLGACPDRLDAVERRLLDLADRYERPVALVGWSLGGLYARVLAQRQPDAVLKVVTMGTPFSGSRRANNAWRAYQFIAGHRVDDTPIEADTAAKPPVETVAIWSPRDGVIAPRSAAGREGERDRAIAVRCTHIGFASDPDVIRVVAEELA